MNNTESAKAKYTYKINGENQQGDVEYNKVSIDDLDEIILNDLCDTLIPGDIPAMPRGSNNRKNYPYFARRLLEEGVDDHIICTFENDKTKDIYLNRF